MEQQGGQPEFSVQLRRLVRTAALRFRCPTRPGLMPDSQYFVERKGIQFDFWSRVQIQKGYDSFRLWVQGLLILIL